MLVICNLLYLYNGLCLNFSFQLNLTAMRFIPARMIGSVQLDHNMSQRCVIFQPIHGHVFAVARLLHASVGHFVGCGEMGVDPGAAILKAACDFHGPADVPGPHG